jgi:membrane-bound serine protease (ClpP class)
MTISNLPYAPTWKWAALILVAASCCPRADAEPAPSLPGLDKVRDVLSELEEAADRIGEQVSSIVESATKIVQEKILSATPVIDSTTGPDLNRKTPFLPRRDGSEPATVYLLPIEGEVRPIMMTLFKRGLEEAEEKGVDLVLLEMDTPGGQLNIAEEISRILLESEVPTATWIKNEGLSAGMLIAISTQRIYMKPVISMVGDCQPIFMTTGEIKEAPEKILTVVREYGERAAHKNGYPEDAVLAMIDEKLSYRSPDGSIQCGSGELLTLRAEEAVRIGFASGLANTVDDVLAHLNLSDAKIVRFEKNWAESIAAYICRPTIASLLTLAGLVGLFIEYKTPGFGIPGGAGLLCLGLVFWGHSIAHLAGMEGTILFLLGVALLGLEIFLLPGFGLAGAAGIASIIVGLVLTFLQIPVRDPLFIPEIHLTRPLVMVGFATVGAVLTILILANYLPRIQSMAFLGLSLATELRAVDGYASFDSKTTDSLIGRVGLTVSPLRPGGVITLDGNRMTVVSRGDFVESEKRVRIVGVEGMRIVVEPEGMET